MDRSDGKFVRRMLDARGFTLIEMMMVMVIFLILAALAAGRYERSIVRAREAALHSDLRYMREAIQNYTNDKQQAPQALDDLVSAGYLHDIPLDPLTRNKDWRADTCDLLLSPEQTTTGICDVHSNSDQTSPFEGTPYSSW